MTDPAGADDQEHRSDRQGAVYASVVTGNVTGGELTAVIAPFRVSRD